VTCEECGELLHTVDLRALSEATSDDPAGTDGALMLAHLRSCRRCGSAAELLIAGERALARDLGDVTSRHAPDEVARHAWTSMRARRRRFVIATIAVAVAIIGAGTASYVIVPEARRLLAPPPPVVTRTFPLTCLSAEQAASLLRPYLPVPENPRWQAERFDVSPAVGVGAVTVRAPQELIDRVPTLLAEFERYPTAACRR